LALDRGELCEAEFAGAQLADDLDAAAARVVDPLALPAGMWRVPVDLLAFWMLDGAGLDDDSVTTRSGRSYGTTTSHRNIHATAEVLPSLGGWGRTTWSGIPDSNRRPSAWEQVVGLLVLDENSVSTRS
jgi:hypothetical protein